MAAGPALLCESRQPWAVAELAFLGSSVSALTEHLQEGLKRIPVFLGQAKLLFRFLAFRVWELKPRWRSAGELSWGYMVNSRSITPTFVERN